VRAKPIADGQIMAGGERDGAVRPASHIHVRMVTFLPMMVVPVLLTTSVTVKSFRTRC
jgi:hypothetical protein